MKKILTALILAVLTFVCTVSAFTSNVDDSEMWEYQVYANGVELIGCKDTRTDIYIPSSIKVDGKEMKVKKLGDNLFKGNTALNSVTLSEGITEIGESAFEGATNFVCIVTSESLTSIGDNAFKNCTSFNSVILYDSVTTIGDNSFENCENLTVYCNENSTAHTYAEKKGINYVILNPDCEPDVVPLSGITYYVGNGEAVIMYSDDNLSGDITIPSTVHGMPVTRIRSSAFANKAITSVTFPDTLMYIEDHAFLNCDSLKKLNFSDSIVEMGMGALKDCDALTYITLPQNIKTVADGLLYDCDNLSSVTISDNVEEIGPNAMSWCHFLRSVYMGKNVKRIGDGAFRQSDNLSNIVLPDGLEYIGPNAFVYCLGLRTINIPEGVTAINEYTFEDCKNLQTITIPSTLKTIKYFAFIDCERVTRINISNLQSWLEVSFAEFGHPFDCNYNGPGDIYLNGSVLKEVNIPEGFTEINTPALAGSTITKINIPEGVTAIVGGFVGGCTQLSEINVPSTLVRGLESAIKGREALSVINVADGNPAYSSVDNVLFDKSGTTLYLYPRVKRNTSYSVPAGVTRIYQYAFYENTFLRELTMADGVINIEPYAFSYCSALTTVTFADSVQTIGDHAFYECTSLKTADLPQSLTVLSYNAFYKCSSLENVVIPPNVTEIDWSAFGSCSNLKTVKLNDNLTFIDSSAFSKCTSLTEITIPSKVTNLGNYSFNGCTSLAKVTIDGSLTTFGTEAFRNCTALTEVVINGDVKVISSYAFAGCSKLTKVTIPLSLTSIGNYAFSGCPLTDVYYGGNNVEWLKVSIGNYNTSINNATIHYAQVLMPESITIANGNQTIFVLGTVTLNVEFSPAGCADDLIWTSSNTSVATVSGGTVTAKNIGTATITAKTKTDGLVASCTITVVNPSGKDGVISWSIENGTLTLSGSGYMKDYYYNRQPPWVAYKTIIKNAVVNSGIRNIGNHGFMYCSNLKTVSLPSTVTDIGERAFSSCPSLTRIEIPYGLTTIEREAFKGCTAMTEAILPDSVRTIADSAFNQCRSLKEINLPSKITAIQKSAFSGCAFTEIYFPKTLTTIGTYAFSGCKFTNLTIPSTVTSMGDYAFDACKQLKQVILEEGITSLSANLFNGCSALTEINIPRSVLTIGEGALRNCSSLQKVIMHSNITTIESNAFAGNYALSRIIIPESVTSIGTNAFGNSSSLILCVYADTAGYTYACDNGFLYFIMKKTENPEVSYGKEITGTVYLDSAPVAGAKIEILYDNGTLKQESFTSLDGTYKIDYAEVGRYTVRATDANGNIASEVVSVKRMNVFDVYVAGDTNLVLKNGYTVSGTVSVAGAIVTLTDTDGNVIKEMHTTDTSFSFANIHGGEYIVKAETENGIGTAFVYVSNEDINDIVINVSAQSSIILGDVKIENRDGSQTPGNWVSVDLYNENGDVAARTNSDINGAYNFVKIPKGNYQIVATAFCMRPSDKGDYDKNCELKGYAHVNITDNGEYVVETIVLREEKINRSSIKGKVRSKGIVHDCKVTLTDESGNQIAITNTANNGTYAFTNIPDGMYCITATTYADGMGFSVITIENGTVFGETDIWVEKADKINKREETLFSIPECHTREDALIYKDAVMAEKHYYDSQPEDIKEKFSPKWVELLYKLVKLISQSDIDTPDGVTVKNEESIISDDELETPMEFVLSVTEIDEVEVDEDGINTDKEFESEKIKDKGKNKKIAKYYDISLHKNGEKISNIRKQTETNGKLLITMDIPEEFRGHIHYSFIHMHNGEATTLVDLDDNPDTVTFEIDKFSTFALAYSDTELVGEAKDDYPASITYDESNGKILVSSTTDGILYIATYSDNRLINLERIPVSAGAADSRYDFTPDKTAFVWDSNMKPLCLKFTLK